MVKKKKASSVGCGCILAILSLPFLLFSALAFFTSHFDLFAALSSDDWPTTQGQIIHSQVKEELRESNDDDGGFKKKKKKSKIKHQDGKMFSPDIQFEFVLDGQTYTSKRVGWVNWGSSDPKMANEIIEKYPVGQEVTVYYDPEDPSVSVLNTDFDYSLLIFPILGGISFLIGLFLLLAVPIMSFFEKPDEELEEPEEEEIEEEVEEEDEVETEEEDEDDFWKEKS